MGIQVMEKTRNYIWNDQREITQRVWNRVVILVRDTVLWPVLHNCEVSWLYSQEYLSSRADTNMHKLENCVYKTQVMPPCPKPVLTPWPILTHDPQHIQSILETNVWNVKVKIAAILSKIIFLCAEKHMHIFNMLLITVQSFKMNAWKPWEELITQSYYLLLKPSLKIV